jgi:hypothetical protein
MKDKVKVNSIVETILEGVEWAVFSLMLPGVFVGMFSLTPLCSRLHVGSHYNASAWPVPSLVCVALPCTSPGVGAPFAEARCI